MLLVSARSLKLGDPERTVATGSVCLGHVLLECGGISTVVPVDGDGVDGARGTGGDEVRQPGQAHRVASVGDCWGNELSLGCVGLHVREVSGGSLSVSEVSLAGVIWLVEGEKVGRASRESSLNGFSPVAGIAGEETPEHWSVLEVGWDGRGGGSPVVGPGNFRGASE